MSEIKTPARTKGSDETSIRVLTPVRKRLGRIATQTKSKSHNEVVGILLDHWEKSTPDARRATLVSRIPVMGGAS